ncbi:hypothetical protein BDV93DRAFT_408933, partial [Ceratobasidium sp. AG-I]
IHLPHLSLSDEQKVSVKAAHTSQLGITDISFTKDSQTEAKDLLYAHLLDKDSLARVTSKWTCVWSNEGSTRVQRVLYQCYCGKQNNTAKRLMPYPFTGCMAHVDIARERATEDILRVHGYLTHNNECQESGLERQPGTPVHPSVLELAIQMLQNGYTMDAVRQRNRQLYDMEAYRDQSNKILQYRYLIKPSDGRTVYRQYLMLQGVNVNRPAHMNIHNWLTSSSAYYKPTLAEAIFHYAARTTKETRLEVCIATPEMNTAAWHYGNGKQILMDGTFGICDRRILLFIVMGIDNENHGVPLAFLLFSAPGGNQATHAGYDAAILTKLLTAWKNSLSADRFTPAVATTDTDLKERRALLVVWPNIHLTLCRFHLKQAWLNNRKKHLGTGSETHQSIYERVQRLEVGIIEATSWSCASMLIRTEQIELEEMTEDSRWKSSAQKALKHVSYLSRTWMREELWVSLSDYGRSIAALKTGLAPLDIASTTNHLESFNGVLKTGLIAKAAHGHRLLRCDVLLVLLIKEIIPSIFQRRRVQAKEDALMEATLATAPGGVKFLAHRRARKASQIPVAYLSPDERRDHEAKHLEDKNFVSDPEIQDIGLLFTCYSAQSPAPGLQWLHYEIWIGFDWQAHCSCPDFQQRGGACKHMRAALLRVKALQDTL